MMMMMMAVVVVGIFTMMLNTIEFSVSIVTVWLIDMGTRQIDSYWMFKHWLIKIPTDPIKRQ